jgi:GDP-L-fucose synthase
MYYKKNYTNLVVKTSSELDLKKLKEVQAFFETEKPEIVVNAYARVGGF